MSAATTPPPEVPDLSLLEEVSTRLARILTNTGPLTPEQAAALTAIKEEPRSVGELQVALGLAFSSTSECVSRLAAAGLVTKERDARDYRRLRVAITHQGKQALRRHRDARRKAVKGLLARLDLDDREQLEASLVGVLQALEQADAGKEHTR